MAGGKVIVVHSKAEWNAKLDEAKAAGKAVVVDFTATWCGPCRMIAPVFEELSNKFENVMFLKVDVDEVADVAAECGISAMPTFHVYKNGAKSDELVGASRDKLTSMIEKHSK